MFNELVVSGARGDLARTHKPWSIGLSVMHSGSDLGRDVVDTADLHASVAQGNAEHISGGATTAATATTAAAGACETGQASESYRR